MNASGHGVTPRAEDILQTVEAIVERPYGYGWTIQLTHAIDRLDRKLESESSEASDLYTDFPSEFPRFTNALSRLKSEHAHMRSMLASLRQGCATAEADDRADDLVQEARALVNALRRHQYAEQEIIQRAYGEDIGGSSD